MADYLGWLLIVIKIQSDCFIGGYDDMMVEYLGTQ